MDYFQLVSGNYNRILFSIIVVIFASCFNIIAMQLSRNCDAKIYKNIAMRDKSIAFLNIINHKSITL